MARPLVEHPLVDRFRRTSDLASASQYAPLVQKFIRASGLTSPADATSEAVLKYVVAIRSGPSRRKSISALEAFFGDLFDRGELAADPARNLSRRARRSSERDVLTRGLAQVGVSPHQLVLLTWRDVARATFATDAGPNVALLNAGASPALDILSDRLLERLSRITRPDLEALLSEPVFPSP